MKKQILMKPLCYSIFPILIMPLLAACTVTPGSNISSEAFSWESHNSTDQDIKASRIKITPETIVGANKNIEVKQSNTNQKTLLREATPYEYTIGIGDVLSIIVWDHIELTAPFGSFNNARDQGNVVRDDGMIFYPFVGLIKAEGRTVKELREELAQKLSSYIERPQLDVRVAEYRSQRFFVSGSVMQPSRFPINDVPVTVLEAINLAGGLTPDADIFDVKINRGDEVFVIPIYEMLYQGDISHDVVMMDGDVLHIAPNERRQVFLMGEVRTPQALPMTNRPLSLTQALSRSGGILEARADGRGVYVIRQSEIENIIDVYQLDMSEAWTLALADQFYLAPRDVVYVSAAPITRWNRWVSNVLPSLQGLFNIDRIGRD